MNYQKINRGEINTKLALLPKYLQNKISRYVSEEKIQQRIEGLGLLKLALIKNKMEVDFIASVLFNTFGKPFVHGEIDFSISYADNNAILGFIKHGFIGVDIERIKAIDLNLYKDYLTKKEWAYIHDHSFVEVSFYKIWTRKEAVVKALGKGFYIDLNTIDVLEDHIIIDKKTIYLSTQFLENDYCLSIASSQFI